VQILLCPGFIPGHCMRRHERIWHATSRGTSCLRYERSSGILLLEMTDYRKLFKSCGTNVVIDQNVYIEHPELIDVGDDVHFYPNCFIQGKGARFVIENNVDFFPGTYVSTGDENSLIEIGHHTHFAPYWVLYGWGGLRIGPYCNIAAHCVFATIGHDPVIRGEKPMAIPPYVAGPITLEEDVWLGANVT